MRDKVTNNVKATVIHSERQVHQHVNRVGVWVRHRVRASVVVVALDVSLM